MPVNDELGTRMKDYEARNQYFLQRRTPVAIRVDMKSGHSFTKGFQRPFDEIFVKSMQQTAKFMCENIQGAVLSFQQSDEITIILQDYKNLNTDAWFNYRTDKMCSIAASMATMVFNKFFAQEVDKWGAKTFGWEWYEGGTNDSEIVNSLEYKLSGIYSKAIDKGAMFDARVFNIPKEEVCNLIYWRQLDAIRNSIQMVGQVNFSHKELQNKSCNMIQEMLFAKKGINWNDYPTYLKRGSCCVKTTIQNPNIDIKDEAYSKSVWMIDLDIPIFKGDGRDYIDKLVFIGE